MSEAFTASNGVEVLECETAIGIRVSAYDRSPTKNPERAVNPDSVTVYLDPRHADALREFFQHERDQELGRWRWPENRDYVVYPDADGDVVVLNEDKGITSSLFIRQDVAQRNFEYPSTQAARAYFDAHPERKPWHDATEGDVWLLEINGEEEALLFRHDRTFISRDGDEFAPEETYITAGRRIWPES